MKDLPRQQDRDQREHGKADQLNPARDLNRRRPAGHEGHRTAQVVSIRPPEWDWSAFEDGALALDRYELWEESEPSPRLAVLRGRAGDAAMQDADASVTVPDMPSPRTPGQARRTSKARAAARRRARRIAGLIAVSIARRRHDCPHCLRLRLVCADPDQGRARRSAPAGGQPRPQVVALYGSLRLQLPSTRAASPRSGTTPSVAGRSRSTRSAARPTKGCFTRMARRLFGGGRTDSSYYLLGGGRGPEHGGARRGRGPGHGRLLAGGRDGRRHHPSMLRGKVFGARIDIQPTNEPRSSSG